MRLVRIAMSKSKDAEKLRKEGEHDYPQVGFDPVRKCNFHLDANGKKVFHQVPDGFEFSEDGGLKPIEPKPSE